VAPPRQLPPFFFFLFRLANAESGPFFQAKFPPPPRTDFFPIMTGSSRFFSFPPMRSSGAFAPAFPLRAFLSPVRFFFLLLFFGWNALPQVVSAGFLPLIPMGPLPPPPPSSNTTFFLQARQADEPFFPPPLHRAGRAFLPLSRFHFSSFFLGPAAPFLPFFENVPPFSPFVLFGIEGVGEFLLIGRFFFSPSSPTGFFFSLLWFFKPGKGPFFCLVCGQVSFFPPPLKFWALCPQTFSAFPLPEC